MPRKKEIKKEILREGSGSLFNEEKIATEKANEQKNYLSVSEFLDGINLSLKTNKFLVAGEVTEYREHEKWISFSLKDKEDNSLLKCFLSVWTYRKAGVLLEDGMEIKIGGYPRVYKLAGSFSFNVETIEPLGEGSLKKAYMLLLKKLEVEGLFARKRPLPEFINKIGIISSRDGVVIHDFMKNLKPLGFKISFYNSRVEGADAVAGIIDGLKYLNKKGEDLDLIIIMRGGGSLESMQAFNNESVCREIFSSKIPVLCGIGHEVDVPIACLVSDIYVSTPTATAYAVNESWKKLIIGLPMFQDRIVSQFGFVLKNNISKIPSLGKEIIVQFDFLLSKIRRDAGTLSGNIFSGFRHIFLKFKVLSDKIMKDAVNKIKENLNKSSELVQRYEKILKMADPERNLRLGYSIVFDSSGKVIKDIKGLKTGDLIKTKLGKGELESEIKKIYPVK